MELKDKLTSVDDLKEKNDYNLATYERIKGSYKHTFSIIDYSAYGYCPSGRWMIASYGQFKVDNPEKRFYAVNIRATVQATSGSGVATIRTTTFPDYSNLGTVTEIPPGKNMGRQTIPITTGLTSAFNVTFIYDVQTAYRSGVLECNFDVYGSTGFKVLSAELFAVPLSDGELEILPST